MDAQALFPEMVEGVSYDTPADRMWSGDSRAEAVRMLGNLKITKAITLTGNSPRGAVTFANVSPPAHGTLTGTAPNMTYTPNAGYTGPDSFTFQVIDSLGSSNPSAPGTVSVIVGPAGTGLRGDYYDSIDFTNLKE